MKRLCVVLAGAMLVALPGMASAERTKPNIHFFSGPQSDAHWTPQDSSDADKNGMSIELEVGPATAGLTYAGWEFNHVEGTPAPTVEPYFWHKEDRESALSGGSPRLVIVFPDGNIQLRPDEWSQEWRKVGGEGEHGEQGNWDSNGGTCGFRYDVTYEEALACHPDAIVQEVFMVSDSNWMPDKATGYVNWIDQIQYDGYIYSHASDNNNRQNQG